jgi:anti-sigma regulatory factor (Ser/Thr protein kinase)
VTADVRTLREAPPGVPVFARSLPAVATSVGVVRRELDRALDRLGVATRRREDIALAVTEATTNVVLHAYLDMDAGPLDATASVSGRTLLVIVRDRGRGMTPHPDSPGVGFGVPLMDALADSVEIGPDQPERGTRVALLFRDAVPPMPAPPGFLTRSVS